jgi:MFS family permease
MGGFLWNESRTKHPLVPLSIFKIRNVSGANLIMAPMYATMLGLFFIITLYLQLVLHYSPVQTGLAFLPLPIVLGFMSTRMPKLVARYSFKRFLIAGPLLVGLGLAWLSQLPVHGTYLVNLLPALLVIPVGVGMTFMPVIAAATSGVPARESGLASGLITTSQQMGGALGLSILSGVAASVTASSAYLGKTGALVHGFDQAILVGLAFMLFASTLAILVIRQPKKPQDKNVHDKERLTTRPILEM